MNIILLNWAEGENDPFTSLNEFLAKKLKAIGKNAKAVDLDSNFDNNFPAELERGVDFALSFQGIGSPIRTQDPDATIWDDPCRTPILCSRRSSMSQHLEPPWEL